MTMTSTQPIDFNPYHAGLRETELLPWTGHVTQMVGLLVESLGPFGRNRRFL